jgi:hypothetical protein
MNADDTQDEPPPGFDRCNPRHQSDLILARTIRMDRDGYDLIERFPGIPVDQGGLGLWL